MKNLKHIANRTGSFLHQLFKLLVDHGTIGFLLLFVFRLQFCAAQKESSSPPVPPSEQLPLGPRFNPSMAIIMVVLVCAFFLMGFFSIYIRRCADRRYRGGGGGGNFDPAALFGGGRLSRRLQMGLDPAVIEGFPTFVYSSVKGLKIGKGSLECAVCLNEFQDDDTLRLIPKCFHVFHPDCIDAWLASHTTCPVCRANLVPRPGDMPFAAVHFFEQVGNSAEPDGRSNVNDEAHGQNQVTIDILQNDDDSKEVAQAQSPDANLLRTYSTSNRPSRSWSNRWSFGRLFPRSHSTGHSLVQPGENCERFTLRLPEEVRSQLVNIQLNRTKSSVAFPRARSSRRGYRSASVGTGRGRNYFNYERFEQGRSNRWGVSATPPFFSRTGSVRPSGEAQAGTSDEVNEAPHKNFLKSVKSPFDRLFLEAVNNNKDVGERSSDRLRIGDGQA